jgi:hypothetical protein
MKAVCDFYEIAERGDGLVDVVLTPGEVVPMLDDLTGRTDYGIRLMAVRGINPEDPQWDGNLEEHIRRHYAAWLESAEEIEI